MTSPAYRSIAARVADSEAAAFVHVGDRFDDRMAYLTRFHGPDRPYAFTLVPAESGAPQTTLCAPSLFGEQARREFPGTEVRTGNVGQPAGERAAAVLAAVEPESTVAVPESIPHAAVARLEAAGFDVTATDAVAAARRVKPPARIDCHRAVQRAATRGMAAAEAALGRATVRDERLTLDGSPLTTEDLRRIVNRRLASEGVEPAGNTVIGAGPTAADLHYRGTDELRAGETILLDLSPRGPSWAYGDCTRTFVVEPAGGWERRAYLAVEDARRAALAELAAGVEASAVHEEAAAELAAHGFRVDSRDEGFTHGVGHGVGFSLHEAPSLTSDDPLRTGDVVTIEPGVYDPEVGGVRLEDTVVVREDGYELLATYPFGIEPREPEAIEGDGDEAIETADGSE